MTKKRKVCSPPQGDQRENYEELKEFIVSENAKCVSEIREVNERRIAAVEESLNFALDSLTALSQRQHSADLDIVHLKKESADLRRRLQQLELGEDRIQQEKRLTTLLFSGPAIQAHARREDAVRQIHATVQERMNHALDNAQVRAMIRLRSGKVLVEFTSASPGSDRDILFRSKAKLRGSGLFISESLTPRRQALFSETLQLKKDGIIFSTFTRAGNIFVCRSRDSAPLRIADPEALRQLAESGASRRPAQRRAQVEGVSGRPDPWREEGVRERERAPSGLTSSAMEVVALSPVGSEVTASRAVGAGSRHAGAADLNPAGTDRARERGRHGSSPSSLLECAREAAVSLVQLSPPLKETSAVGATTAASSAGVADRLIETSVAVGALGDSASPGVGRPTVRERPTTGDLVSPVPGTSGVASPPLTGRPTEGGGGRREVTFSSPGRRSASAAEFDRAAVARPSADGGLGSPLPVTPGRGSPPLAALASGEGRDQRRDEVRVRSPALASGESGADCLTEQRSAGGSTVSGVGRPDDSESGVGGRAGTGVTRCEGSRVGGAASPSRQRVRGYAGSRDPFRYKDIRDFF